MQIRPAQVAAAAQLVGLAFTPEECELMCAALSEQAASYALIRSVPLPNSLPPAISYRIAAPAPPTPPAAVPAEAPIHPPADPTALAFASVATLAQLVRTRQVSASELTELYLARLHQYDQRLHCVVTLTADLAREQAQRADAEIATGRYRGPLHGIPWGAKDLLATHGIRTTWGATPYRNQLPDHDATVVRRLADAGAVLLAKLTLGELALGDVWFGGTTRNPWNIEQGSSGSSSGSAAAAAAGLAGFTIGSETWGSIVSPSTRCGATGLRPTFGRVSRAGAMTLSWSMDKLGPICRSVEDCALVFAAIYGPDGLDDSVADYPFAWRPRADLAGLRVGYLQSAFDEPREHKLLDDQTLAMLEQLGAELVPIALPAYPIEALALILSVEAAAAFDELTRLNRDDLLVRQVADAWPNMLRAARLIPAVEYIQANRVRTLVSRAMAELMRGVDVYVAPSLDERNLLLTNLTGHPAVVLPNGFSAAGQPSSITFIGQLFGEAQLLAATHAYQQATEFHLQRPPL